MPTTSKCRSLVAGRLRRAGAEIFPQGRRAGAPEEGRGRDRSVLAVAVSVADEAALKDLPEKERFIGEHSAQAGVRPARRHLDLLGLEGRLFRHRGRRPAFFDEHRYMLAMQMVAPNSPQWFNTGLHWAYGIDGPSQGHFYVDFKTGKLVQVDDAPTSIRSRTPASSSRSPTTSSTRAASWTCGCARRACSNTAPAPARISRSCAAKAKSFPAAASRRA